MPVHTRRAALRIALPVLLTVFLLPLQAGSQDEPTVFKAGEFISKRPPGRWRLIEDPSRSGVTVHERERVYDGLNFYTSGHEPGALLMDMEGSILHEWTCAFLDAWPEMAGSRLSDNADYWRSAHLFDNGEVIAVFDGHGLVRLDKDSNILWARAGGEHEEVAVAGDGTIYALTREATISRVVRPGAPILENFVVVIDGDGNELASLSVLDAFLRSEYAYILDDLLIYGDIFHIDAITVLEDEVVDGVPEFARGNVLLSLRKPSLLAIMDMDLMEITWVATGAWVSQHDPCVLPGGTMLVFDNEGHEDRSRLIEFDPATGEHVWTYQGDDPDDFYTKTCGSVQRLPNGNTLATESDRGRVIEVAPDGSIVWEYQNPVRSGDEGEFIATIFEMRRLRPDFGSEWLSR